MAFEQPFGKVGLFIASTSFSSTDQYCLVKVSTSGAVGTDVRISDTQGEMVFGVLDDIGAGTSGSAVPIVTEGVAKVLAGSTHAAITVGTILYSGGGGNVHTATSSGYYPVGMALEALAADTSGIISAYVRPSFNVRST